MKLTLQAFRLSTKIIDAISFEEVDATWNAMVELGIANPPYPDMDIFIRANTEQFRTTADLEIFARVREGILEPECWCQTKNGEKSTLSELRNKLRVDTSFTDGLMEEERFGRRLYRILLVLLATRNTVKRTTENKLAKLGIGTKKNPYRFVTELELPGIETLHEEGTSGTSSKRRPHLRRGHIRNQKHGPGNEFTKKIWIEPMFIHADEEWIGERTGYNVHLKGAS